MLQQEVHWSCYASGKPKDPWFVFGRESENTLSPEACEVFNGLPFEHAILGLSVYICHGLDTPQGVFAGILSLNCQVRFDFTQPAE